MTLGAAVTYLAERRKKEKERRKERKGKKEKNNQKKETEEEMERWAEEEMERRKSRSGLSLWSGILRRKQKSQRYGLGQRRKHGARFPPHCCTITRQSIKKKISGRSK